MASGTTDENVENTKRHIRGLVNEVEKLAESDVQGAEFYPAVLQRTISALAAAGGAIWLVDEDGGMRLAHQIQMEPTLMQAGNEAAKQHGRLLSRLFSQGRAELVPPMSGSGDEGEGNPTRFLLVTAPLVSNKSPVGLMEILQRPDALPDAQRGYLRFLEHIARIMSGWLQKHTLKQVSTRQELWQQSDQFARLVHDNLDLNDTAYTIANEGRRLIECDRVSVAILKGGKAKVVAISGQDTIENRSNIVQSLNNLATRVVRSGEPLWYDGSVEDLPPQLEEAIEDYVDLSHGRTVTVLPIRQPERKTEGDVLAARNETNEARIRRDVIGALIVEQIETQLSRQVLEGRVDLVYEHACRALSNAQSHSQIFLMPVWKFLDRISWMFRGSALPKTATILSLIGCGILAMFLVPIDFDMEGNGQFKPSIEKNVFAHVDGEVERVLVKDGDYVQKDQVLVELRNRELDTQVANVEGDLNLAQTKRYQAKRALSEIPNLSVAERTRYAQEETEAKTTIDNQTRNLKLLLEKKEKLLRRSPIEGIVTTWNVERTLNARPVVTGQVLMTIADPTSPWEIEVYMPEKRMRYIDEAMRKSKDGTLPIDFILKSDSASYHKGKLMAKDISQRSELHPEDGAIVKLRCIPDPQSMTKIHAFTGTEVVVDVKCGKRSAAFVVFQDVIEWIRVHVLF